MAKIFRLHTTGGKNTISHWDTSTKMGRMTIDSIPDPIDATNKYEITSIPSPFARMDLVKQAFKIVAESTLDGTTAYHKLVSDSLDVGQIFFNIEKYRKQIEIIVWDKKTDLNDLLHSENEAHQCLGRTYDTFLKQDGKQYNFDSMDCIYLLNYIDPSSDKEMDIIGATSPATVFFTSANNLEYVGKKIKFSDDSPFDSEYKPLYKRTIDYIKYWWSLKKSFTNFTSLFPEVDAYLEKTYARLTEKQRDELKTEIKDGTYYPEHYDEISVTPTAQQSVMVLKEKIRRKKSASQINSGFKMKISAELTVPDGKIPLALPVEKYTEQTFYVEANWDPHTYVPFFDSRAINNRTLPDDGSTYPYVTVSDFLEDIIVKIPYKLNSEGFFDGNDSDPSAKDSFILPLKKTFFDYFTCNDLRGKINGKNRIEMIRLNGGAVKVILRIPITGNGGYVKYDRIYYKDGKADAGQNKGSVVEREFTLGLYPPIQYPAGIAPYYRVTLLDVDSVQSDDNSYALDFYDQSNHSISIEDAIRRNRNSGGSRFDNNFIDFTTYILNNEFQYIAVCNEHDDSIHRVVIPKFSAKNGNHSFRFAIDFGTTNTHIEYSMDGVSPKAFHIAKEEKQIQKLHQTESFDINTIFDADFIPETIGTESRYEYPMRTVLAEGNNTNWMKSVWTMGNVNIPYTYEKSKALPFDVLHTDLKWSTNNEDRQRASKYIESLLILLRNKVLLNNGDLRKTEIVWFYPASMTQFRYNLFKAEWEKKFVEIFGADQKNIISISESVAPYYFYKNKAGATSTTVSIDIGGGTTDVLLVKEGEPIYLSSFRFAANSIFGDGYSYDSDTNGFVKKYEPEINKALENIESESGALQGVLKSFIDKRISTDIIAFMFSLASNKNVKDKNVTIDFSNMLGNDNRAKYVILLFYTAIVYHIAKIMKAKNIDMPRHITFSGNGSKVLNILSTGNETLEDLTKMIFEQIYHSPYPEDGLEIIRPEHSKESTCKGGILMSPFKSQNYAEIKELKTILVGVDGETFGENLSYSDITDNTLDKVVDEVKNYIEFTFNLNKKISFFNNFEMDQSIMDKVKTLCLKDLRTYLSNGIAQKRAAIAQDGADDAMEETLFFYPITGMLNAVVRQIYNLK